ncbi:MAG: TIGR01777 family protein [Elusimicrobia bacterium]|nr:TIGR01777 family protein [Elusimicrobiota bacterium]
MRIIVAGATGFIGRALCGRLAEEGHSVTALARRAMGGPAPVATVPWDGLAGGPWASALDGADAVVNLCGKPVACRWTDRRKAELRESRLATTAALVDAMARARRRPSVLVNASASGYYGDAGDRECGEAAAKGRGFLAELCADWEAEASKASALGVRTALLRSGVVLAADGGALPMMALPFWLRAGGPMGGGRQWVPWISRRDLVRAISFILGSPLSGPVNAVSPGAVTNRGLSQALGRALKKPCWLPAPAFAVRLALGEMAEMLLTGQKAVPTKLLEAGFRFEHPDIDSALQEIFR